MPELIFLDTHIWFWLIAEEFERFPADWREAIGTAPQVGVLPISGYAIALTEQRGRLELPCATEQWLQEALEPSGISLMLITERVLSRMTPPEIAASRGTH